MAPALLSDAAAAAIAALDLREITKHTYVALNRSWLRFLGDGATADALTNQALLDYRLWLRDEAGHPRRVVQNYITAAKHVLCWLDLNESLPDGVTFSRMEEVLAGTKGRRREPYIQRKTDPEIARLLGYYLDLPLPAAGAARLILLRNRALVQTLYDAGMRISEALALTRDDVADGRALKVRLVHTKNGKPRTVFLSDCRPLIQAYCAARADGRHAPLFVSHGRDRGGALTPRQALNVVKIAARALGLLDTTSPHSLRHARAQQLFDAGMPLEWVATLLGHSNPGTTRTIYAFETDETRLQKMVAKYG